MTDIGTRSSTTDPSSTTNSTAAPGSSSNNYSNAPADSPEATCPRAIAAFCESGNANAGGEEVLHLPVIVEAAESSPAAAAAATHAIRNFLGKEFAKKPHVQYNAIMLVRILCDNPGASFTRNFDKPFVSTVKELLRNTKDVGTQQIMRETLDALEVNKQQDANLQGLLAMWTKEKGHNASLSRGSSPYNHPQPLPGFPDPAQRSRSRQLPNAVELASRVEEARNTAKILLQLVQSTAAADLLNNELIKEFSERCQSAQRSMQVYIGCQDPAPDHDTMQTLIETNEQLSLAMSRYQRAVLAARRELGVPASPPAQEQTGYSAFAPPPAQQNMSISQPGLIAPPVNGWQSPAGPPPSQQQRQSEAPTQNPFADPEPQHLAVETGSTNAFSQPANAFSIDSGAIHAKPYNQRNELENTYSTGEDARTPVSQPSPVFPNSTTANDVPVPVSPQSPPRPGPGPYHQSEITQSYVGRQSSAVNGLTMHGAGGAEDGQGSMASRGRGY